MGKETKIKKAKDKPKELLNLEVLENLVQISKALKERVEYVETVLNKQESLLAKMSDRMGIM